MFLYENFFFIFITLWEIARKKDEIFSQKGCDMPMEVANMFVSLIDIYHMYMNKHTH